MKIFAAGFHHETCNFSKLNTTLADVVYFSGNALDPIFEGAFNVFKRVGANIVKSTFFSDSLSAGGLFEKSAFMTFAEQIISDLAACGPVDGIMLRLHGASDVEDIGQGEIYILRRIRETVGYDVPIAITMDPHGNISPDITKYANIIRAYHTAPHVDQSDACAVAAEALVDCIKNKKLTKPVFVRLPMLINGDAALTAMEPMKSVIAELKALEATGKVYCASFFISFVFADVDNCYPCVVYIPKEEKYRDELHKAAVDLAHRVYERRKEFRFGSIDMRPEEAVEYALTCEETPVTVSDSGDNTTGGAAGYNTCFLRMFMERGDTNGRKVLVSTIFDPIACGMLMRYNEGDEVDVMVGIDIDEDTRPIRLKGILKSKGKAIKNLAFDLNSEDYGNSVLVSLGDIDVSITDIRDALCYERQFDLAGIKITDYSVLVVKEAYQFNYIADYGKTHILAYTPGGTYQDTPNVPFTKIPWTIFPRNDNGV